MADPEKSGFKIVSGIDCSVSDLASGDLVLEAAIGGTSLRVPLAKFIRCAAHLEKAASDFSVRALEFVKPTALQSISNAFKIHPDDISGRRAVGLVSADGAAIVGHNGSLFVYGGTNSLASIYLEPAENFEQVAIAWRDLMHRRIERATRIGAKYIQLFIPEKSSICSHLAPFPVSGVSGLWRKVVGLSKAELPQHVIDGAATFDALQDPVCAYRLLDSHLAHRGAEAMVIGVINRLGLHLNFSAHDFLCTHSGGDLSKNS
ncbi:hypothetical protein [Ideonella sp.]|uniref:hypothetical protein n=1 Tax=Ideonella sp. TaxID=1929293 RepID=UPI0037C0BD70